MSILDTLTRLGIRGGLPEPLPDEPFALLMSWYKEAAEDKRFVDANAMVLATSTPDGKPSARVVLCKAIEAPTASLVFYTNYASRKGAELEANPRASCVFYWDQLQRQVRVEGWVERVTDRESDEYFASRALLSRIGSAASLQSRPMARRADFIDRVLAKIKELGIPAHRLILPGSQTHIPRPADWGGFRLHINRVELWAAVVGRLHDRAAWSRVDAPSPSDRSSNTPPRWTATRLFP